MLAHLDLLPQRKIGRHVQRASPYDGHRVDLHPYEPSRSRQDWEGSLPYVVEPPLNDGLHVRLPHLPRALIPVPDWGCVSGWRGAQPPLSNARARLTRPCRRRRAHGRPSAVVDRTAGVARLAITIDDPRHPLPTSPPATDTVLKERRQKPPAHPHPHLPLTPGARDPSRGLRLPSTARRKRGRTSLDQAHSGFP